MKVRHYLAVALTVFILQGVTPASCRTMLHKQTVCDPMRIETCEP